MSAQSIEAIAESGHMELEPLPDWVFPPPDGFTADLFLRMRGLPRHTELIDGSLVFVSPQRMWHAWVLRLLEAELDRQAPTELRAIREMAIKLAKRQVPEPDVMVVKAESFDDADRTSLLPDEVVLAIEAVSPDSVERDRETKPVKYAAAGIKNFWRVEEDEGRTVVYVYELDPATRSYVPTGIHHDQLKLTVPFDIDIDLTAVGKRR
ncbi:Uma2 family endonuclease [Actinomadura welshii]|uniref:Uma2 family endonuclease n=1 Tax=Actinomadura welshii TaxID=3103817 RepID=UPI001F201467|nr:Uma2 family endonuclease [Actinomadura madurae]